jgi:hypothetical protein
LIVARRYHVGSFDDDSSYILAARALAAGHGLTSRMAGGYPLIGVYPPGYPALLSPLAAIWPSGTLAFRALSLALFVAVFPLTWRYLSRREVAGSVRLAVLVLLALNPVLATYATMVMPETTFVVVLLLMLLALDLWEREVKTLTWAGAGSVVAAASLMWLKEAGLGLVIGVVVWLLLRRMVRKALLVAVGSALLFLPLLVVRIHLGTSLIGSRYSEDVGGVFKGGLGGRVLHVVPQAVEDYATSAIHRSVLPTIGGFLPNNGPIGFSLVLLSVATSVLVAVGFFVWCRRYRDAACVAVPVYLVETLFYPFTNERRVVLILPVIVAWFAVGGATFLATVGTVARRRGGRVAPRVALGLPVVASILVLSALASQVTKDYLFFEGASSSSPDGSPYMAFLRQLGSTHDVVATDYLWTTALYSGHRTANRLYLANCDPASVAAALRADAAAYALTAALNTPGTVDDACILPNLAGLPQAVRLYRSADDLASVFELVGPGTPHPAIRDLTSESVLDGGPQPVSLADEAPQGLGDPAGQYPFVVATNGVATLTWSWKAPVSISQLSLGAAAAVNGDTASVTVAEQAPDGAWRTVAEAPVGVGAGTNTPFLLVTPRDSKPVTAVRVTVAVKGELAVAVHDFHALGGSA